MSDIQALLSALDVFSRAPDKDSLERANAWLQDFQHSPDAWATCNLLLLSADAPPAAKLFAAQTFRSKVTYDLHQMGSADQLHLRDTLVTALERFQNGPKTVTVQICLALSGLALQLSSWSNAVQSMIDRFGRNPTMVPVLLQFLTILPEEIGSNSKIPMTDEEYQEKSAQLLTENSKQLLDLLSMYNQASGVTHGVQAQILDCLRSWLVAGEVAATDLAKTALFAYLFEALGFDDLFDSAVDVICELIHETQEIDDNMSVIQLIVPRVIAIKSLLTKHQNDPDKIRGYARILSEAGETYRLLLLQHTETFFPIVEAIGECSAYPDLDIVPITFTFWMRLAQSIGKKPYVAPVFVDAYKTLMSVIIRHLHFPVDINSFVGQEAESFRSFRHVMGDTLKDCCYVLGTDKCLMAAYEQITVALARPAGSVSWQEIEAPLFAMRSMGAEVDPNDDLTVPKIMDLIPSLPLHPRVRYAALLIISRYTEWINLHPKYIQYQLQYIAAGFEDSDTEVTAAAGQALKYMCQDCRQHLVDFLPTLHTFLNSTGWKLPQEDRRQVYEAIAFVISAMPMEHAAESLRTFSLDILALVHSVVGKSMVTQAELREVCNGLDNLEIMLQVIHSFGDELPAACQNSCEQAWSVLDAFLDKYGMEYDIAERASRVIRYGINFFGRSVLPIAESVMARMTAAFEATDIPSYLWIGGKMIGRFGQEEIPSLQASFRQFYERCTNRVVAILQLKSPRDIPDVLEDYLQMLLQMADIAPDLFYQSTAFPLAFRAAMAALTLVHSDIVFAALDLFRNVLTHDCLSPSLTQPSPNFAIYASVIQAVIEEEGFEFVGYLLNGLVGDFPEESTSTVVSIFRGLVALWSSQVLSWLPAILQHLPTTSAPNPTKTKFLADMTRAVNSRQFDKVKYAIVDLHRSSRKARDRRRMAPLDT